MRRLGSALAAAATFAFFAPLATAQSVEPSGDWSGAVSTPRGTTPLFVHLQHVGDGYAGTLDSPDQQAKNLTLSDITVQGDALSFSMPAANARFSGHWDSDAAGWRGQWSQGQASLPLLLTRVERTAGIDGVWSGLLETPRQPLHLVVRIWTTAQGVGGDIVSLDQSAQAKALTQLKRRGDHLAFKVPGDGGMFEGRVSPDGRTLVGQWTQSGSSLPLTLTLGDRDAKPHRPQTPRPPFPYRSIEVAYDNPTEPVHLAGTLTVPEGAGPFPAALLITGSGQQDRDEAVFDHKPFLVLADYLSRRGIAVLRVDDRGVGGSTGDVQHATSADFATDVEAGVQVLKARPEIDPRRIGLIGHSEGGLIAPMVAVKDPSVAFLVLMAGPALRGDRLLSLQLAAIDRAASAQMKRSPCAKNQLAVLDHESGQIHCAKERSILSQIFAVRPDREPPTWLTALRASSNWADFFLTYDPAPTLRKLRLPVLAIGGTLDVQVPVAENTPALRKALARDPDAQVVELPGLNHLFQTAHSGLPGEYAQIEETISPAALKLIGDWAVAHTQR